MMQRFEKKTGDASLERKILIGKLVISFPDVMSSLVTLILFIRLLCVLLGILTAKNLPDAYAIARGLCNPSGPMRATGTGSPRL